VLVMLLLLFFFFGFQISLKLQSDFVIWICIQISCWLKRNLCRFESSRFHSIIRYCWSRFSPKPYTRIWSDMAFLLYLNSSRAAIWMLKHFWSTGNSIIVHTLHSIQCSW
jgi:hypothetical protein